MKTVMVVIDGLGDEPIAALDGRTPLEAAFAPHLHFIASRGSVGQLRTTFPGHPIESMVCIMGLLGYDPARFYPKGRASFEAMAKGIPLHDDDLVLRCNIVSVDPDTDSLADFTAGLISDSQARTLISRIELPYTNWELYPGQSYRNILIVRGGNADRADLRCFEPHMHIGEPVNGMLPRDRGGRSGALVKQLGEFLIDSRRQIAAMDTAAADRQRMLWVWSPSHKPVWPSFRKQTGLTAAVVGGLDFLHGIAMAAGIHFDVIPGANGYIDTDYDAKAAYTIKYLRDHDFILTHVNAADEEAHQRNYRGKIEAIERTDRRIIGPVLQELQSHYRGEYRIVVCGDHATRCCDGKHTDALVPFAMYGKAIPASNTAQFGERGCHDIAAIGSLDFLRVVCQV
jgi:2,3-bisphosphoglycerate-independent phosphoglycerate mutase